MQYVPMLSWGNDESASAVTDKRLQAVTITIIACLYRGVMRSVLTANVEKTAALWLLLLQFDAAQMQKAAQHDAVPPAWKMRKKRKHN